MYHLRHLKDRVLGHLKSATRAVARRWKSHRRRLAEEVGYGEALAEVLVAAADLCGPGYRIRYAIRELIRAYIALQRIVSPPVRPWEATPTPDI